MIGTLAQRATSSTSTFDGTLILRRIVDGDLQGAHTLSGVPVQLV